MKLENRTILITGGTSGIGLGLAQALLLKPGNTVIVTGRDPVKLADAQRALPDPDAIKALHDAVLARFPGLDTLFNNAGIMRNLDFNLDPPDVTREIEINLNGPIRMVRQFLPHLKTRDGALIVNVSSGLAFIPLPASPVYSATKAAMHSFSQSLRIQLRGSRVTIVELAPPGVETALFRGEFAEETKHQKAMPVATLVQRAISGIEAGALEIRPGLANVLKAMSRIAPNFMLNQLAKMTKPKGASQP
jgi:uncharacterized oxidoreductase